MSDVLLTLVLPQDIAEEVEDLLLSRPDLVIGFTSQTAHGHGTSIKLVAASEMVAGHVPRIVINSVGPEAKMREVLALIKSTLPMCNLYYWLVPVSEMGRL